MAKRFGRPAPNFDDDRRSSGLVRQIRLTREGSDMEGVYDSIAAIDAMQMASTDAARKRAVYDGLLNWVLIVAFWGGMILLAAHFVRNLHT